MYRDGIVGLPAAFYLSWADRLHEDFLVAFADGSTRPDGLIARGPNRYYLAVHPERVRGFVELVSAPEVVGLSSSVLGEDYQIVDWASTWHSPVRSTSPGIATSRCRRRPEWSTA